MIERLFGECINIRTSRWEALDHLEGDWMSELSKWAIAVAEGQIHIACYAVVMAVPDSQCWKG